MFNYLIPSNEYRVGPFVKKISRLFGAVFIVAYFASLAVIIWGQPNYAYTIARLSLAGLAILICVNIFVRVRLHLTGKAKRIANLMRAYAVEVFAFLMFMILKLVRLTDRDTRGSGDIKQPVLFVHGYLGSSSDWIYHCRRLKEAGYANVFSISLGSPFHSIEDYALMVKKKIEEITAVTGRTDLKLVGFSMGGLVSSYYAVNIAPKNTISDVITLGSPLHGTKASILAVGECGRQMAYQSLFVSKLNVRIAERTDIRFYNAASAADEIVVPNGSALLDSNAQAKVIFDDLAHFSYLFSDRVADALIRFLTNH